MKDRNVPIWIGCFSLAVILLLGVSVPIQFSDARFKDAKQGEIYLFNICDDCVNTQTVDLGAESQGPAVGLQGLQDFGPAGTE